MHCCLDPILEKNTQNEKKNIFQQTRYFIDNHGILTEILKPN